MPLASIVRTQIETALSQKIPSALTPAPKMIRPVAETGIESLDDVLQGGLPVGAISELVGPECSGRTSIALSFLARITYASKVCAWIDVSNAFDPASASAAGVDLSRLLWVRCGGLPKTVTKGSGQFVLPRKYLVPNPTKKGLHGGGFGPHPRSETKGLSQAVNGLLHPVALAPRCAEPQHRVSQRREQLEPEHQPRTKPTPWGSPPSKPWSRMEQALRATDLLLQGGGFSAIVFDMGSLSPEFVSRVPLATWFRYRAAAERTQSSILLLSQHGCAKSSAELLLRLRPARASRDEATVFSGIKPHVEVARRRFAEDSAKVIPLRKPAQSATAASWQSRTTWAGRR
jgi:recombination protein RecA